MTATPAQTARLSLIDTQYIRQQALLAHATTDHLALAFAEERAGLLTPLEAFDVIKDWVSRIGAIREVLIGVRNVTGLAAVHLSRVEAAAPRGRHSA